MFGQRVELSSSQGGTGAVLHSGVWEPKPPGVPLRLWVFTGRYFASPLQSKAADVDAKHEFRPNSVSVKQVGSRKIRPQYEDGHTQGRIRTPRFIKNPFIL